jgi:hypothetical protein
VSKGGVWSPGQHVPNSRHSVVGVAVGRWHRPGQAGIDRCRPTRRASSARAPRSRAPPRGCCEGRREPSLGDPMRNRRSQASVRAGFFAGSSPRWGLDGEPKPGSMRERANASRGIGCGRRRRWRAPRAGPVSRKRHPQARGAGAVPSRDQHRTVKRRRWISLGSGRFAIPHPGRTQPNLDLTPSGGAIHRTPSGGTWT